MTLPKPQSFCRLTAASGRSLWLLVKGTHPIAHASRRRAAQQRPAPPASPSWRAWCVRHGLLCFCVLAAAWVLLLYWHILQAPFVYDDLDGIVHNPALGSWHTVFHRFILAPVAFTAGFLGAGDSTYRPLFWISIALNWRLWGVDGAAGFHFASLLLHWLNGVLLFLLLRRSGLGLRVAGLAALVWLGLPVNSEAVAWISAQAYLLSSFFLLAALLSALGYLQHKSRLSLLLLALCAFGAVFSHEQGLLLLPLMALLLFPLARHASRGTIEALCGIPLLADACYLLAEHAVHAHAAHGPAGLWAVGEEFWIYLQLIFFPVHMSVERSTGVPANLPTPLALVAAVGLLVLLGCLWLVGRKRPAIAVSALAGCLALLPYCGLVHLYQGMAERFTYLAAMGFVVAAVLLNFAASRPVRTGLLTLALVWLAWGMWRLTTRVADWSDPVALYSHSLQATPRSATLENNLGYSLREAGDSAGALAAFTRAVHLKPDYAEAYTSIADLYAKQGSDGEALANYRHSLSINADDAKTLLNYGVALQKAGNRDGAEQQFQHVLRIAPQDSAAYVDLGGLYNDEGRTDEATRSFQQAVSVDPTDPDAYFNLAVMFQRRHQDDLALALYRKVLQLKPDDPETLLYMSQLQTAPHSR